MALKAWYDVKLSCYETDYFILAKREWALPGVLLRTKVDANSSSDKLEGLIHVSRLSTILVCGRAV